MLVMIGMIINVSMNGLFSKVNLQPQRQIVSMRNQHLSKKPNKSSYSLLELIVMVNYIWMFFIGIGIIYAIINGKVEDVTKAIFASSTEAVTISIGFISVFVFWLGMMKIAEET